MGERWKFQVRQGGQIVASGEGPSQTIAAAEGRHYAMMYAQDGPVELSIAKVRTRKHTPPKAEAEHG